MTQNYYTMITNIGIAKEFSSYEQGGNALQLTEIAIGDGNGAEYNPTGEETALQNENYRAIINNIDIDSENSNRLIVEAIVPATEGGFHIREVGIFDSDGDLFAIGKYPSTYKPLLADGVGGNLIIRMILEFSSSPNVNMSIDPNISICTETRAEEIAEEKVNEATPDLSIFANKTLSNVLQEAIAGKGIAKNDLSNVNDLAGIITALGLDFGGGGSADSVIVAPSNATQEIKDAANYVCDGTADDVEIQEAVAFANSQNLSTIILEQGDFYIDNYIDLLAGKNLIGAKKDGYNPPKIHVAVNETTNWQGVKCSSRKNRIENLYFIADSIVEGRGEAIYANDDSYYKDITIENFRVGISGSSTNGTSVFIKNKALNCKYGFSSCDNIILCTAEITSSYAFSDTPQNGISNTENALFCTVKGYSSNYYDEAFHDVNNNIGGYAKYAGYGFYVSQDNVSHCLAEYCDTGFYNCYPVTNCQASYCNIGFNQSRRLSNCRGYRNITYDFQNTWYMSNCLGQDYDFYEDRCLTGFYNCSYMTACGSEEHLESEFKSCHYISSCHSKIDDDTVPLPVAYDSCTNVMNSD